MTCILSLGKENSKDSGADNRFQRVIDWSLWYVTLTQHLRVIHVNDMLSLYAKRYNSSGLDKNTCQLTEYFKLEIVGYCCLMASEQFFHI
jgi:hypothetical protein